MLKGEIQNRISIHEPVSDEQRVRNSPSSVQGPTKCITEQDLLDRIISKMNTEQRKSSECATRRPCQGINRYHDQGWFHGRRWLVWLFPLTYPSYRVLLMSRESAKCSFLKKKFFYNNSPIYSNNLIASKKLVTWHPLGRHIPIPYSSWTETYQKNHLSKKIPYFD